MPTMFAMALRVALSALCLQASPAEARSPSADWAGSYIAGSGKLMLYPTGKFDYDGSSSGNCFPDNGGDVGFVEAFSGRYRMKGGWIVLKPETPGYIGGCSGIALRLFAYRVGARRYLFDEHYLRRIAHEVRRGADPKVYYPWHTAGEPAELTRAARAWLPPPFAHMATTRPPSGQVIAIGPVQKRTLYGAAGRIEGEQLFAILTLNFGRNQGAFEGMPICVPGTPPTLLLQSAAENTSTLGWVWSTTGAGAPDIGQLFESACNDSAESTH